MSIERTTKAVRHLKFARAKVEGKNNGDAAIEAGIAGPKASRKTAREKGCRANADDNVRAMVDALLSQAVDEAKITTDLIIQMLLQEAVTAPEGGTRVRALELLGKTKAMFTDRSITEVRENTSDDKLIDQLKRTNPVLAAALEASMTRPN